MADQQLAWAECGGPAALTIPANNAACARQIWRRQGWCGWSTFGDFAICNVLGHTNAYLQYIGRARAALAAAGG